MSRQHCNPLPSQLTWARYSEGPTNRARATRDARALNTITLLDVEVSDPGQPWDLVRDALLGEH